MNAVVKTALADIKQGSYIAVTAMPQHDGSQKAVAILIFPEAMRGIAEGHRPWDLTPNSTMTNATVDSTVAGIDGQTLVVKYKDGEKTIVVPPSTEIVTYVQGDAGRSQTGCRKYSSPPQRSFQTARWRRRIFHSATTASGGRAERSASAASGA